MQLQIVMCKSKSCNAGAFKKKRVVMLVIPINI
jgi:hypothetical protein